MAQPEEKYQKPYIYTVCAQYQSPATCFVLSCPNIFRGEKKPIPEDLKDEKYFERRKRNNLAAKKSRDQRKV